MAKTEERIQARKLRKKGESVKEIAKLLGVSKSSVSLWVRDIVLSVEQLERLKQRSIIGGERGRLIGALKQKTDRLKRIQSGKLWGRKTVGQLNKRERLLIGIALYWAEGSKKSQQVHICNSDPRMINFMIRWLSEFFDIKENELRLWVGINIVHKVRDGQVKKYWSDITGISLNRFNKTSFKKVKNKKVYLNHKEHFGTLNIRVLKPSRIYYKILGLVKGLSLG